MDFQLLKAALQRALDIAGDGLTPAEKHAVNSFLTLLANSPTKAISALENREMISRTSDPRSGPATELSRALAQPLADQLRAVMNQDEAFRDLVLALKNDRKVTRDTALAVYAELFPGGRKVAKSASKPKILEMLRDERNVRVSHEKMAAFQSGVAAE